MLDHANDLDVSERLTLQRLVNRFCVDRLVAILQPNLEDPRILIRDLRDLVGIGNRRRDRLLDQDMLAGFRRGSNRVNVGVIRRADYQAIDIGI